VVEITVKDSVYIHIDCDQDIGKELTDFFTFIVPGAEYTPAFKYRKWDGKIRLFNMYKGDLYRGLLSYVIKFCEDRKYKCHVEESLRPSHTMSHDDVEKYMTEFLRAYAGGREITPHAHQIDAVHQCLNNPRTLLLSPTGSGKSLIIYALLRYYQSTTDKKILILVPTTSLVEQMYSDFADYASDIEWDVSDNCHKIYSGKERVADQQVTISTWQSLYKMPKEFFDQYEVVFGDECHLYKAKSLIGILTKLDNCPVRIGCTGTLDGTKAHRLVIEGLFGPVYKAASTKELIEKDILSEFEIDSILLKYPMEVCNSFKRLTYQEEIHKLVSLDIRNEFIVELAQSVCGNTLVLFQYVNDHGVPLYENLLEKHSGKVFLVHGGIKADDREEIRRITEQEDNAIIVASYGTFSTGVSIKRLHNIIFASPSKSRIRVLQSIGRHLRKSVYKDKAKLFDISDDLRWKKYVNHTYRHYKERIEIYRSEDFDVTPICINIG